MKKRLVSMLLCVLLAFCGGGIVGCKNNGRDYDPDNFITPDDPLYETGQIVKDKITVRMFVPRHALHGDWNQMRLFTEMEKITNIHVEFVQASESTYAEMKNANFEDGNKNIDAYMYWNTVSEQIMYAQYGMIAELGPLMEQYAPNYNKVRAQYPEIDKLTTLSDGKIYTFAKVNTVPRDLTFKQFINKQWLEALDLDMPTTTEELKTVLRAFKTQDPNGDGFQNEIPLSSKNLYQTRNFLMSAFGYVSTGIEVDYDTNTIVYVPSTDNYYQYLKYANELFNEGLLDNNVFTMSEDRDLAAKGSQGIVGSFDHAAAYLIVGNALDDQYTAIPPLTSAYSNKKMWLGFDDIVTQQFVVTADTPYKRELVRWFDFLYSDQGKILQAFGLEGTDWSWDNAEQTSWTFHVPEGMDIEAYRGTLTPAVGLEPPAFWDKEFVLKDSTKQIRNINKAVDDAGYMAYLKRPVPQLRFTDDESAELSTIKTDLDNLVTGYETKFISAKSFTRADFDDFVKKLKQAKYERYVEIYQTAYNRYASDRT